MSADRKRRGGPFARDLTLVGSLKQGRARRFLVIGSAGLALVAIHMGGQSQVSGVFNTGVDDTGTLLASYAVDPHYTIIASADPTFPGPDAVVVDDTLRPLSSGEWLTNSSISWWIGPQGNQDWADYPSAGDLPGDYTYRTTFDLTGYDPGRVVLAGQWSCESLGTDVLLNGVSTSNATVSNIYLVHVQWNPLLITNGFAAGINTLDFVVNRVDIRPGNLPTGMQVQLVVSNLPPPKLQMSLVGSDLLLWWPTNAASFVLEPSSALGANAAWTQFLDPILVISDQNVAVADPTNGSQFFRLHKP
jgi:hypothetical protein